MRCYVCVVLIFVAIYNNLKFTRMVFFICTTYVIKYEIDLVIERDLLVSFSFIGLLGTE